MLQELVCPYSQPKNTLNNYRDLLVLNAFFSKNFSFSHVPIPFRAPHTNPHADLNNNRDVRSGRKQLKSSCAHTGNSNRSDKNTGSFWEQSNLHYATHQQKNLNYRNYTIKSPRANVHKPYTNIHTLKLKSLLMIL